MNSPRVFVTRRIFPEALDLIGQHAQLEVWLTMRLPRRKSLPTDWARQRAW